MELMLTMLWLLTEGRSNGVVWTIKIYNYKRVTTKLFFAYCSELQLAIR